MDWGLFYMESSFFDQWKRYRKALIQRNALLKNQQYQEIDAWNHELAYYGTIVAERRKAYIEHLKRHFVPIIEQFLNIEHYDIRHCAGWDSSSELLVKLQKDRSKDIKYGYTHNGPHSGDFLLLLDGRPALSVASRGQMKIIVLALKLAQVHLLNEQHGRCGCILIDDLASELDKPNQSALLAFLSQLESQVFITSTTNQLSCTQARFECALFTMKQGHVMPA